MSDIDDNESGIHCGGGCGCMLFIVSVLAAIALLKYIFS